ncbi:Uncharacterised protein [Mycobacteroides abscessus subsp. abscessus]|nr:Uncharacterised protein [Mycobacteroides abscessus subsp. abscessus]
MPACLNFVSYVNRVVVGSSEVCSRATTRFISDRS